MEHLENRIILIGQILKVGGLMEFVEIHLLALPFDLAHLLDQFLDAEIVLEEFLHDADLERITVQMIELRLGVAGIIAIGC